jgi:dihydroorotate dehydrogenase
MIDLYRLVSPVLFRLDAERAHRLVLALARFAPPLEPPAAGLAREVMGLRFRSPLGLAAGMDKDAAHLELWRRLGFGFVEVGTVTPRPQAGNPRPRLFRIPEARLILNRMGFNSAGANAVARKLELRPDGLVVGVNVGRNRDGDESDYALAYRRLAPLADYAVLNVSSPNTPGLRRLQAPEAITRILESVLEHRVGPVLVKISPDEAPEETVEAALSAGADGVVATNTTVDLGVVPPEHRARIDAWGEGGISGRPLRDRSREVRRRIAGRGTLVACGGIGSPEEVLGALAEGADLVQIYSSLVFEGPALVRRINAALALTPMATATPTLN